MKVTQANKFTPIVITLETETEAFDFKSLVAYGTSKAAVLRRNPNLLRVAHVAALGRQIWNNLDTLDNL